MAAPVIIAAPEQIAAAVVRAMLQGGASRADGAVQKTAEPLPKLIQTAPKPLPLTASAEEATPEKPKKTMAVDPPMHGTQEVLPPAPAQPAPEPIPALTPAPTPVLTPVPVETSAAPATPRPALDPVTPRSTTELLPSQPAAQEAAPQAEVIPPEKRVDTTPVAFALRLTAPEAATPRPEISARTEFPTKAKMPLAGEVSKIAPDAAKEDAPRPAAAVSASSGNTEHRDHAPEEKPHPGKTTREIPREAAPAVPELRPITPNTATPHLEPATQAPPSSGEVQQPTHETAPVSQAEEAPKPAHAAHEIAVRVSAPDASHVDLHVTQRGAEVRVAVRTTDAQMQSSLRQNLGKLVDRLEQTGFHAESVPVRDNGPIRWERTNVDAGPVLAVHGSTAVSGGDVQSETSSQRDGRDRDTDPNQSGSRQQQQQQRRQQQRRPTQAWEDFA